MNVLTTPEATFNIAEEADHSLRLSREGHELNLWKISLQVPTEIFVLAENEKKAIGQAYCITELSPKQRREVQCSADKVPFGIRGWSKNQF